MGHQGDPRIPEECRVDPMTRIKEAGKAGVAAYTLTEFAFWLGSVPLAIALVAYTTGSLPDFATTEGKEAVAGYVFVFINFARVIVPLRIALALALAPWCERNIIEKFFPAKVPDECEVCGPRFGYFSAVSRVSAAGSKHDVPQTAYGGKQVVCVERGRAHGIGHAYR